MKYEKRLVAFIDILGFRSLLEDTVTKKGEDNEKSIDLLIEAYSSIRDIWDLDNNLPEFSSKQESSKKVSIFSDCLVVSVLIEQESQVFYTLLEIKWLIMRLINLGILCRGAVSLGKFIHTNEYLFGPALVEAYTLESKAAMYPRVILDNTVIEAAGRYRNPDHSIQSEKDYVRSILGQDSDGLYYIDYFYKAHEELDDPMYQFPQYIHNIAEIIRKGLMGSSHPSKADVKVKFSWMRERYNSMVSRVTKTMDVEALLEASEDDLAEFYKNLKKISPNKYKI